VRCRVHLVRRIGHGRKHLGNLGLHAVTHILVTLGLKSALNRARKHARMLARTVVVDRPRALAPPRQCAGLLCPQRPMAAAGKRRLAEPRLGKHFGDAGHVLARPGMRAAGQRQVAVCVTERIGCS